MFQCSIGIPPQNLTKVPFFDVFRGTKMENCLKLNKVLQKTYAKSCIIANLLKVAGSLKNNF